MRSIAPSSAQRCRTTSRPSAQPLTHVTGVHRSRLAIAGTRHAPRKLSVTVRSDVNWDAFRSTELGSRKTETRASSAPRPSSAPGGTVQQFDYLVIGSGIAGLSYALKVAQYGTVALVTKDFANEGCTQYAQGGVCAVLDRNDSVSEHVRDTIIAGAFLNDPQ